MTLIGDVREFKTLLQGHFDENELSLERFGQTNVKQVKAYLIESNRNISDINPPVGMFRSMSDPSWYRCDDPDHPNSLFIDTSRGRVWIIYCLLDAQVSDHLITQWIGNNTGLDRCWMTRPHLMHFGSETEWREKGIGLRFSDGLVPEDEAGSFSLKAWYGANQKIRGLGEMLEKAKENFAISSIRWQKVSDGEVRISEEWYNNGKVTINRGVDVDEILSSVTVMANRYQDSLTEAQTAYQNLITSFEIDFKQEIDLNYFAETVAKGKGKMNLWLVETESSSDFKRFSGVDLHTWDRILLDISPTYAYLSIPKNGCVNAAPRIAVIQGEDNAGLTSVYLDGVEMFA
jgi:hypothetical protein